MDAATFVSGLSVIATTVVGFILSRQIKSQKEIIDRYKGLVEAVNPEKIIVLHEREVSKIKEAMNNDISELKTQAYEMAIYLEQTFAGYEQTAKNISKPELFDQTVINGIINRNMPHCVAILDSVREQRLDQLVNN